MVHFPLHSSLISVFSSRFHWLIKQCRVQINHALCANATVITASLFGQSVNGWTCSSPESRIFVCRRDAALITASIAARAQKLVGNMSCFVRLSQQVPSLAFGASKRCLPSVNHDLLGSGCFMAAGVLTAGMTT
jgi:chromosome condensin MukBEF MukE localization factor